MNGWAMVQNSLLPGSKIFASLRLCVFALKKAPTGPKMSPPDGAENLFGWGLQIFRAYGAAGD
jgi:hypothetical protein